MAIKIRDGGAWVDVSGGSAVTSSASSAAATQLSPRSTSDYRTIDAQGTYIHWNRTNGDGGTWLINQRGGGAGGFYFGESTSDANNTFPGTTGITTTMSLDASGMLTVYHNNSRKLHTTSDGITVNDSVQLGAVSTGFYGDSTNLAVRMPAASPGGGFYVQSNNGAQTWAIFTSSGLQVSSNITNAGFDFYLGNGDQTSRGNSGASRALVKDNDSTLVVNFQGDYTGGTRMDGPVVGSLFAGIRMRNGVVQYTKNLASVSIESGTTATRLRLNYTKTASSSNLLVYGGMGRDSNIAAINVVGPSGQGGADSGSSATFSFYGDIGSNNSPVDVSVIDTITIMVQQMGL